MDYYYAKTLADTTFDAAVTRATEVLKEHGFGILTEIDVTATMKQKLDRDFRNYRILGACNPGMAWDALQAEDRIGTMLPCNVIVQQHDGGDVEVAAVDPVASMQAVANPQLTAVATKVRDQLRQAMDSL